MDAITTIQNPPAAGQAAVPAGHISPLSPAHVCDPENEQAAQRLRAYIPIETIQAINEINKQELAESSVMIRKQEERSARRRAIKDQMAALRIEDKRLKKQSDEYFSRRLFQRTDAARSAAWRAASQARAEAVARGEAPRYETAAETGVRMQAPESKVA